MEFKPDLTPVDRRPVTVFAGDEGHEQPHSFKFCPLGIQFVSSSAMELCSLHEFTLNLPGEEERHITCCGIVASCSPSQDGSKYDISVKFLDLPESARKRIESMVKSTREFLCPYCENF
jgi:hypothetical protein